MEQWTDEQEMTLLKGVVKWKPVGMHKHFRMVAIHDYMTIQGVINPNDEHTRIPGLWQKLGTLYNLPILDEREDSIITDSLNESDANASSEFYCPFSLPEKEYGAMMFERRLDPNRSESPVLTSSRRESTIADTDEPTSSPAPGRRSGRNFRGGGGAGVAKGSRASKLQNEFETSRKSSKAASSVGAEDEPMEDAPAADEEGAESASDEDDISDNEEEDESVKETPRGKTKASRGSAKTKPSRARPAKRRGGRRR